MRVDFWIVVLSILSFFQTNNVYCESCPASTPTIKEVESCPNTTAEWQHASDRKQCQKIQSHNCKSFVYHCLMNQNENTFLEVCAPTWFMSGFCAMFNTREERVIDNFRLDCTNFTEGEKCPSRFISSEAYKYQECYELVRRNIQNSSKTKPTSPICKYGYSASSGSKSNTSFDAVIITVVFLSVLVIALLVFLFLIRKQISWRKVLRRKEKIVKSKEEENERLLEKETVEEKGNTVTGGKSDAKAKADTEKASSETEGKSKTKLKDIQIDEEKGSPEMKGKSDTKDKENNPGIEKGLTPADAKAKIQNEIIHLKSQKRVTGPKSDRTEIQRNLDQERKGKKADEPIIPITSRPDLEKDTDFATARTQIGETSDTFENTTNPNNLGQCLANDGGTIATEEINQESDMQNGKTEEDRNDSTVAASDGIGNSESIQNLPEDQEDEGDNQPASTAPGNIMYSRKENEVDETEVKEKELQNPPINEVLKTGTEMKTSDGNRRNPEQETVMDKRKKFEEMEKNKQNIAGKK